MKELFNRIKIRLTLAGILIACLFLVPAVTQAQYKWLLNGFITVSAGEDYFGSNVLKDVGQNAFYPYTGWDGKNYKMPDIEICNYINALLANKQGDDVDYTLTWSIKTYDKNGTQVTDTARQYQLKVNEYETSTGSNVTGTIHSNGGPVRVPYYVSIISPTAADYVAESGTYVEVEFEAVNTKAGSTFKRFERKLSGKFRYTVNLSMDFIKSFDAVSTSGNTTDNSRYFNVELGTSELPSIDMNYQTVVIWWNTDYVEINPYNFSFLTYSAEQGAYTPGRISTLEISNLGSNKYRPLGFVKSESYSTVTIEDINNSYIIKNAQPSQAEAEGKWLGCYVKDGSQ